MKFKFLMYKLLMTIVHAKFKNWSNNELLVTSIKIDVIKFSLSCSDALLLNKPINSYHTSLHVSLNIEMKMKKKLLWRLNKYTCIWMKCLFHFIWVLEYWVQVQQQLMLNVWTFPLSEIWKVTKIFFPLPK